jgi:hypothetical protein
MNALLNPETSVKCDDQTVLDLVQRYFDAVDKRRTAYAAALKQSIVDKNCGKLIGQE